MSDGIEVEGLAARRGGRIVFADLSLSLRAGGALRITGPNGVGKSTLLRLCAGLLAPAAGSITLTPPAGRPRLGYLGDAAALDGERPLAEALGFWARLDGLADPDARVAAAMADVALADLAAVPARMLSTGQRRRAAFARIVAGGAFLWLLDEPTNGLDDAAAARMEVLVERHLEAGGMAIVATHLPLRLPAMRTLAFGAQAFKVGAFEVGGMTALLWRGVRRGYAGGGATLVVVFFLLAATLFPFAIGPDAALLARIGGVVWAAALLAALLPVDRLVAPDLEAGVYDQVVVRGHSLAAASSVAILAHCLAFAPPLMAAAVIAAGLLGIPADQLLLVEAGLAIGTPGLAALAVATAALTASLRSAGAIAGLVMLPLAVPLLIFGAGALSGEASALKLLAAVSLLLVAGAPFVAAAAIRAAME